MLGLTNKFKQNSCLRFSMKNLFTFILFLTSDNKSISTKKIRSNVEYMYFPTPDTIKTPNNNNLTHIHKRLISILL